MRKRKRDETELAAEEAAVDEPQAGGEAPDPTDPDESELERLARERAEYLLQWQRAQADFKNLRRRHLSEIEASRRRAMQPLLENLLVVLDHLDMALKTECTSEESRNLALGVQLTRDQFLRALEQEGVTSIDTSGTFDPGLHDAVATVSRDDLEPGTIVDVVRNGWAWGEQVLRPAHVRVAAAPAVEGADEDESGSD